MQAFDRGGYCAATSFALKKFAFQSDFMLIISHGLTSPDYPPHKEEKSTMAWNKPAYTEMRFGFEVTMYICTR
jgi:coenzyme PQQ precursor peptide PqqA